VSDRGGRPAWIEIDHDAIRHNLARLRSLVAPATQVIGVVKANAYGHGDVEVARTLRGEGVERLAVATVAEGIALREAGIGGPLLVLWGIGQGELDAALQADLELLLHRSSDVAEFASGARRVGRRAAVHLKVDSGLGRQGIEPEGAIELAAAAAREPDIQLVGTFSHLAVPGEDDAYTDMQLLRFARALDGMRSAGVDPGIVHVSASGGILAGAGTFADAIRPGLTLYGMVPASVADRDPGLVPALTLKALPLRIFDLPAGEAIGYGLRFRAARTTRIATLGIGYGDGWPRSHINNGWALVRGVRVPMVGAVSMDGITVDVGEVPDVTYDDEFVLIGEQIGARITADEVAAERRTINYEVTTALRRRLPRVHLGERQERERTDHGAE
jgi:alanine racemase